MTEPTAADRMQECIGRDQMTTTDWYYGVRDYVNGGYDGLLRRRLADGGLTLSYLTRDGWVEENALIHDLHDPDTRPVTEAQARGVALARFGLALSGAPRRPRSCALHRQHLMNGEASTPLQERQLDFLDDAGELLSDREFQHATQAKKDKYKLRPSGDCQPRPETTRDHWPVSHRNRSGR